MHDYKQHGKTWLHSLEKLPTKHDTGHDLFFKPNRSNSPQRIWFFNSFFLWLLLGLICVKPKMVFIWAFISS